MPPRPLPVLPGVYYARINALANTRPVSNILVFKKDGLVLNDPTDAANSGHVATAIAAEWPNIAINLLHQDYVGVNVQCYPLGSVLTPAFTASLLAPGGDTSASSFLQVAGSIKHTVYRRGKGSQSHTYLSPVGTGQVSANGETMTSAWVSAAQSHFPNFITTVLADLNAASPGTWTNVQLSRLGTGATYPVVNYIAEAPVSSQKRRLGR